MKPFICFTLGITLLVTAGYAARDVTCYEMIVPDTNTLYIEADAEIIPTLGIANLGNQAELNFPVRFVAIDTYGKLDDIDNDTIYTETTMVAYIGPYPDTIEVEFPEWTLEGICHQTEPFVFYELIGLVRLGIGPTDTDDDPSNDTIRHNVTCLLSYDVGVVDFWWPEDPPYEPGSTITATALVENYGFHKEYDIPVRMVVRDVDSNDVELWSNTQSISSLDWRGNEDEQPYTTEVTFPPLVITKEMVNHHITMCWRTELENDLCPDNDVRCTRGGSLTENQNNDLEYSLEAIGESFGDVHQVRFTVPCASWVKLDVFDASGRWITSLANDIYEAGHYTANWNSCDAAGRKAATGVYLIHMQAGEFKAFQKIVILK